VRTWLQKQSPEYIDAHRADIAASIQDAIVSVLVEKQLALPVAARSTPLP